MEAFEQIARPSKIEQKVAMESYSALAAAIQQINSQEPEIEIEETKEKIKIPIKALRLLGQILKSMSQGKHLSIVPVATEVTTQKAAEMLGCSRPYFVKLLEEGKIEYTTVGRHRRIKFEDVLMYKDQMKKAQKQHIKDIMNSDEEIGLYDS
ncbi:MAG TPA: helix-turn-helix domain-containing protein [Segetibacter sp.]|jgi:excisionase family DNA binding protein